jgi:putative spermidine/putrescine transport system ATP-binding protein
MADLVLNKLVKRYNHDDPPVVKGVSLSVRPGELVSFLGPSGCGKTTILRMIAGLILPEDGMISIKGKEVASLPSYKRDIGMVFQNYALFPHMTVKENVAFGMKMRKKNMSRQERNDEVNKVIKMVNLDGFEHRYPKQLSGGQQQRVALARALVLKPAVLLLDEPLSALDAKLRFETREEIRRLQQELGLATVFVTHDQEEAMAISDRVAVLSNGVVQQYDKPEIIFEQPKNEFVARFMGIPNVFKVTEVQNKKYITHEKLIIEGNSSNSLISAVAVRPERIRMNSNESLENNYSGTVVKRIYSGAMVKYSVKLHEGPILQLMIQSDTPEASINNGRIVTIHWKKEDTLLLEPEITA